MPGDPGQLVREISSLRVSDALRVLGREPVEVITDEPGGRRFAEEPLQTPGELPAERRGGVGHLGKDERLGHVLGHELLKLGPAFEEQPQVLDGGAAVGKGGPVVQLGVQLLDQVRDGKGGVELGTGEQVALEAPHQPEVLGSPDILSPDVDRDGIGPGQDLVGHGHGFPRRGVLGVEVGEPDLELQAGDPERGQDEDQEGHEQDLFRPADDDPARRGQEAGHPLLLLRADGAEIDQAGQGGDEGHGQDDGHGQARSGEHPEVGHQAEWNPADGEEAEDVGHGRVKDRRDDGRRGSDDQGFPVPGQGSPVVLDLVDHVDAVGRAQGDEQDRDGRADDGQGLAQETHQPEQPDVAHHDDQDGGQDGAPALQVEVEDEQDGQEHDRHEEEQVPPGELVDEMGVGRHAGEVILRPAFQYGVRLGDDDLFHQLGQVVMAPEEDRDRAPSAVAGDDPVPVHLLGQDIGFEAVHGFRPFGDLVHEVADLEAVLRLPDVDHVGQGGDGEDVRDLLELFGQGPDEGQGLGLKETGLGPDHDQDHLIGRELLRSVQVQGDVGVAPGEPVGHVVVEIQPPRADEAGGGQQADEDEDREAVLDHEADVSLNHGRHL